MINKKNILLFIFSVLIICSYQNCGDVSLQNPTTTTTLKTKAYSSKFCLKPIRGIQYSLIGAVVINLNAIPSRGSFLSDSDMDGLADIDEIAPYTATNARSRGYLDSICASSGTCPSTPSCVNDGTYFQLGITSCDLDVFTSLELAPNIMDSNFNGIPDFIEIIRKGDPFSLHGGLSDPDQDNYSIDQEILNATDPRFSDAELAASHRTITSRISNDETCPLPFENYEIRNEKLPQVMTTAFVDPNHLQISPSLSLDLSHAENQNIIYTSVILRSREGISPVKYEGFLHLDYINESNYPEDNQGITIESSDFISIGSWQR